MERDPIDLAAQATQAVDPHERLAAVKALRDELDELEAANVADALRAGSSWSGIAAALGVSRQAAHKRHARKPPPPPRAARTHRLMVSGEARVAVALARHEAGRRGHRAIDGEHLLLGVLGVDGSAGRALESLGITLDAAAAQVDEFTPPAGVPSSSGTRSRLPLTASARAALEQSMREVVGRRDRQICSEHLLLALLRDEEGGAVRVLAGLGVSTEDVARAIDRERQAA
jgi:ClpA/ClpB-like protein